MVDRRVEENTKLGYTLISFQKFTSPYCLRLQGFVIDSFVNDHDINIRKIMISHVMKLAQEKIDQCLRIQPLRGGNLLYIT